MVNGKWNQSHCELHLFKTTYPKSYGLVESVNKLKGDENIYIKKIRSYRVSTGIKATCCWIFKKRKNGRHWIHKIKKKPGDYILFEKQFHRKRFWVSKC